MKHSTKEFTFTQFAIAIGFNERLTQDASLPFHKEYTQADEPKQKQMRTDWIVAYLQGWFADKNKDGTFKKELHISKATKIFETPRTERTKEQQQAVDRARHKFSYHVVRAEESTSKQVDLVKQALAIYAKMSGSQKRSFKAQL